MHTPQKYKPAGRGVKDTEVLSAEHDALLSWAIKYLDQIVANTWGLDSNAFENEIEEARQRAKNWLDDAYSELTEFHSGERKLSSRLANFFRNVETQEEHESISSETTDSINLALKRKQSVYKVVSAINLSHTAADAKLNEFSVMKPVYKVEERPRADDKWIHAGFIDIEAKIFIPSEFLIDLKDYPRERGSRTNDIFPYYGSDKELREFADALVKEGVRINTYGRTRNIWISVRTDNFTLGQILQELKALRLLQCESDRDTTKEIILLVNQIDNEMRNIIDHEGFVVIARDDYKITE